MSMKQTTKENSFDDEYMELKVSNESYFKATIKHIAVPLALKAERRNSISSETSEYVIDIKRFARDSALQKETAHSTHHPYISNYATDPLLALDIPTEETTQFVSLPLEDIIQFIEFPNGLEGKPKMKDDINPIEVQLDSGNCIIRSIGKCEIKPVKARALPLGEVYNWPKELRNRIEETEDSKMKDVLETQLEYTQNALQSLTGDIRKAWAKEHNCYGTTATVETVTPKEENSRPSAEVTVSIPSTGEALNFMVNKPGKWNEDHPVIRFVEEVGQGQITGAELEDCYVTFEKHNNKAVAKSESGMYLYVEKPEAQDGNSTSTSRKFFRDFARGFKDFLPFKK